MEKTRRRDALAYELVRRFGVEVEVEVGVETGFEDEVDGDSIPSATREKGRTGQTAEERRSTCSTTLIPVSGPVPVSCTGDDARVVGEVAGVGVGTGRMDRSGVSCKF